MLLTICRMGKCNNLSAYALLLQSVKTVSAHIRLVGISALLHFLVDGLCICCLYLLVCDFATFDIIRYFVVYNVLAFLTQPLTGYMVDRVEHKHWVLLASVLLLTLAVLFVLVHNHWSNCSPPFREGVGLLLPFMEWLVAVLLGLGNSLFHVWGGQQVAVQTRNDMRSLGVFVSTGAFGLAVGGVFASWPLLFCLLAGLVVAPFLYLKDCHGDRLIDANTDIQSPPLPYGCGGIRGWLVLFLLLVIIAFVAFRSSITTVFITGIGTGRAAILLAGFLAMSGKAFGGFLCRWTGLWRGAAAMLVVTAVAFFLSPFSLISSFVHSHFSFSIASLGLFAISCTMPVTLYLANKLLPGREGLSFGLLAAALMPGYLLATGEGSSLLISLFPFSDLLPYGVALIGTILIELGVLWLLLERRKSVLCSSVVVNVLTNVPLNLLILHWGIIDGLSSLLLAEVLVVLIEALWYFCFVRQWRQAFIYSLLCNAISFLVGMLFEFLYMMIY